MPQLLEQSLLPASGGGGEWDRVPFGLGLVDYADTIEEFTRYMDENYDWAWAEEISGLIHNQDGGIPFKWRIREDAAWSYAMLFIDTEDE